jgi:hypothetical protein
LIIKSTLLRKTMQLNSGSAGDYIFLPMLQIVIIVSPFYAFNLQHYREIVSFINMYYITHTSLWVFLFALQEYNVICGRIYNIS